MTTELLIENALNSFPRAKRDVVENFCFSAPDDAAANSSNLASDAQSYQWNPDTINAITMVLLNEGKIWL